MARYGRAYPAPSRRIAAPLSTLPPPPVDVRVTALAPNEVSIAWDPPEAGALGFGIYLDGVKQGDDQTATVATLAGLVEGRTYLIEVDSLTDDGRSDRVPLVVTTPDVTAPTVPVGLRFVTATRTSLTVAWEPSTDNVSVVGYSLYLDGQRVDNVSADTLVYTYYQLAAGTSYLVTVDALDLSGNRSAGAMLDVQTERDHPPSAPPNLRATTITYTSIAVSWDEAADEDPVTGYDVAIDGELVATNQPQRTAAFSGLVENTEHTVRVWAVDAVGQRTSRPAELVVRTLDDTPPTAPVFAVTVGEEAITVAWEASSDDFGVSGYRIDVDGEPAWSTPGVDYTVDGPVTRRHTVTSLAPGANYRVRVVALDALGQESADNTVVVPMPPLPFLPISSPVYRLGPWAGNARDEFGVDWVVEDASGWASTPPVRPASTVLGGVDGAWSGAGQYGSRVITLEGVAVAPSQAAMLAAKQRLVGVLHPRDVGVLRVEDALRTRRARVRLVGDVEAVDRGPLAFSWSITLQASDPRRYAVHPVSASAVVGSLPGQASLALSLSGTYPQIPARLRLYGPIKDWTITHEESGTVMRAMTGASLPPDPRYSLSFDLATRQVLAHVPPDVWPVPRPGRSAVAHLPAWFMLLPGLNTLTLSGQPLAGASGQPRLVVEAYDAWV
ncbi:hypothetical protein GCM10010404_82050 [Nonomuraea africana]|uniref:Chitodextrinase n=1 Tax=Nonomuraea africana TaxID=46171 RepID=A0ABR9KX17_9ACTN|nr:fibronectin type III domain-containing protein [Nonomuraea africana]MBE1566560.1 chitodextrinase [Nonomuraea africana]